MKTKMIVLSIFCVMIAMLVTLTACKKETEQPETLIPMSEVRIEDHILSWDEVENARYYSLKVMFDEHNGFEVPVANTSYSLNIYNEGTYTIYVRPVFDDGFGAYSPALTYTLQKDVVLTPSEDGKVLLRGEGTFEDPILIYTREELESLTDGKRQVEEDGKTVKYTAYYRLMADIDLSGKEWKSIGAYPSRFGGVFDGNGHTISGLTQTKAVSSSSRYSCGLFAELDTATVANLTLTDVDIRLSTVKEEFRVGGITGYSLGSTIENCSVSGTIQVNSPITDDKRAYVGMLVGDSNGTAMRRITVAGDIDVTFAKVYAGGVTGISRLRSVDSMDNILSYVNVKTHGTARSGNTAAGLSYAAGIAFLSNIGNVSNIAWFGTAKATVVVGTPADKSYYANGMFVVASTNVSNGMCQIEMKDCFFDVEGVEYDTAIYAPELYDDPAQRLNDLADRYAVGNATKQLRSSGNKRITTVYGVDATCKGTQSTYMPLEGDTVFGLDFDTVWTMTDSADKPLALQEYHSEWFTVTFVLDDGTVISTQHILKGQPAKSPVYKGDDDIAVKWDYDGASLIESDMTIRVLNQE